MPRRTTPGAPATGAVHGSASWWASLNTRDCGAYATEGVRELSRLAKEREACPEDRVLRQHDLAERRVDLQSVRTQIAQQLQLSGSQGPSLVHATQPGAIEIRQQSVRGL